MQLIYRGYIYPVQSLSARSIQPGVINWRYRIPGKCYEPKTSSASPVKPRALNWRYQMAIPG